MLGQRLRGARSVRAGAEGILQAKQYGYYRLPIATAAMLCSLAGNPPSAKRSVRRTHSASSDRARNSRAFQTAIPTRILRQISLVIVLGVVGIRKRISRLRCRRNPLGRLSVDVAREPSVDLVE